MPNDQDLLPDRKIGDKIAHFVQEQFARRAILRLLPGARGDSLRESRPLLATRH